MNSDSALTASRNSPTSTCSSGVWQLAMSPGAKYAHGIPRAARNEASDQNGAPATPPDPGAIAAMHSRSATTGSASLGISLGRPPTAWSRPRSEEHTSELQSRQYLVCRLLLEKKNKIQLPILLQKPNKKQQKNC